MKKLNISNTILLDNNLDLMLEIFIRLPIKSLFRFKSVCKCWNSLISSSEFTELYQQHSRTDDTSLQLFMLCHPRKGTPQNELYTLKTESSEVDEVCKSNWFYKLSKPAQKLNHKFDVKSYPIGSCNGLICFIVGLGYKTLSLWNPATQESFSIRGPHLSEGSVPFYWGFGYDPLSDDYKVVVVGELSNKPTRVPFVKIYTMRSNRWRRVKCPSHDEMRDFMVKITKGTELSSLPIQVGRFLYWWVEGMFDPKNLLAFNLTTESFEIVTLPNSDPSTKGHICEDFFICQLKQSLCACWLWNELAAGDARGPRLYLKVWMSEGCGSDRVWRSIFRFRGLHRWFKMNRFRRKLFELKEHGKYIMSDQNLSFCAVVDPRGELRHPPKTLCLKSTFDLRYIFEYTQTLASPNHYI